MSADGAADAGNGFYECHCVFYLFTFLPFYPFTFLLSYLYVAAHVFGRNG